MLWIWNNHMPRQSLKKVFRAHISGLQEETPTFTSALLHTAQTAPHEMLPAFWIGCVIENGWCLFPWSCKGITNKMPQPWTPPRGKLEKRLYVHSAVEMKIQIVIRFSHWRNPQLKYFVAYPFGTSREKASAIFYDAALNKNWPLEGNTSKSMKYCMDTFILHAVASGTSSRPHRRSSDIPLLTTHTPIGLISPYRYRL